MFSIMWLLLTRSTTSESDHLRINYQFLFHQATQGTDGVQRTTNEQVAELFLLL